MSAAHQAAGSPHGDVWQTGLAIILASPHLGVALFFMYLCGIVLSFLLFQTNPKFEKQIPITSGYRFNLAIGFLPGSLLMVAYTFIQHRAFPPTLEQLSVAAIPSALVLAGMSFILVLIKAFTR